MSAQSPEASAPNGTHPPLRDRAGPYGPARYFFGNLIYGTGDVLSASTGDLDYLTNSIRRP